MLHSRFYTLFCAHFILFLCLTACTRTVYVHSTLPGIRSQIEVKQQNDPVTAAAVLLKPKSAGLIVIDPGHGGKDFGTHSRKPPYQEKYLTLTTAYMLQNYLQQLGFDVVLTRKDDVFVSLDKRTSFANERKTRLFVSLHYNSAPNKQAEGIEIYYFNTSADKERAKQSKKLAQAINKQIVKQTKAKSRGVKHGDLAVIRETEMPAVLIEGGFLTNEGEMTKLKNAVYLKKLALGIAHGIKDYLAQDQKPLLNKK